MTRLNLIGFLQSWPVRSFLGVTLVSALALLGSPMHALAQVEQSNAGLEAFGRRLQSVLNADGAIVARRLL